MKNLLSFIFVFILSLPVFAQINQTKEIQTSQKFGSYTVHYNVFNSKMVPAHIAETYKLLRSKDTVLINISLTKTEGDTTSLGLPAKVNVKAVNLMQQSKSVEFLEIKETDATYYLAQFRHTNEEDIRFEVSVLPQGENKPLTFNFTRKLFVEN